MTLIRPRALLLDFGGVIVTTTRRPAWAADLTAEVVAMLTAAGCAEPDPDAVERDIVAGAAADSAWKNAMSRLPRPAELTPRMFWADFVAGDWPPAARAVVTGQAWLLCRRMGELRSIRTMRNGLPALLDAAAQAELPVVVVSNALSGVVHRDWLERAGMDKHFAFQIYSDEVGLRKPNPEIVWLACEGLGLAPADVWYVGDNFDRDVACGRRAGVGATVLMNDHGTDDLPFPVAARPDAVVDDPAGLLILLRDVLT
jgi:HAD superfamily hydrolase (TIGR01549 family)